MKFLSLLIRRFSYTGIAVVIGILFAGGVTFASWAGVWHGTDWITPNGTISASKLAESLEYLHQNIPDTTGCEDGSMLQYSTASSTFKCFKCDAGQYAYWSENGKISCVDVHGACRLHYRLVGKNANRQDIYTDWITSDWSNFSDDPEWGSSSGVQLRELHSWGDGGTRYKAVRVQAKLECVNSPTSLHLKVALSNDVVRGSDISSFHPSNVSTSNFVSSSISSLVDVYARFIHVRMWFAALVEDANHNKVCTIRYKLTPNRRYASDGQVVSEYRWFYGGSDMLPYIQMELQCHMP